MSQETEEKIVVSIRLPKKLYKRFKIMVEENDETVTNAIAECMKRYIETYKKKTEED